MALINKVMQCDVRAVPVTWIHKRALFGALISPCPRGAAGLCPLQQLLPCSLSFTLSCQHSPKGTIPLWGALAQVWDWAVAPNSSQGSPASSPSHWWLHRKERGCLVLMVPFSKGQQHSSFHVLPHTRLPWGHPTPLGDGNCVPWLKQKKRADFAPRYFAH